eukprot:snap_masked-scaffold_6-processed-gene-10.33-mRNA-1 protein AED:0.08 eAED:0.65 QI:0/-1/0/1/-1/1/1/0/371
MSHTGRKSKKRRSTTTAALEGNLFSQKVLLRGLESTPSRRRHSTIQPRTTFPTLSEIPRVCTDLNFAPGESLSAFGSSLVDQRRSSDYGFPPIMNPRDAGMSGFGLVKPPTPLTEYIQSEMFVGCDTEQQKSRTGKGGWSNEEDAKLLELRELCEEKKWTAVSKVMTNRTAKQCRERWIFTLDPSINHGVWNLKEDLTLLAKQREIGNKWAQISQHLPGRTENSVKTRYKGLQRAMKNEWHPREDKILIELYSIHGRNWMKLLNAFEESGKVTKSVSASELKKRVDELREGIHRLKLPAENKARRNVRLIYYPKKTVEKKSLEYISKIQKAENEFKLGNQCLDRIIEEKPLGELSFMSSQESYRSVKLGEF